MRIATAFVCAAGAALWLGWELVLVAGRAKGEGWETISMVLKNFALRANVLPFAWGLLGGHLFVAWDIVDERPWFGGWWAWVATACLLLCVDVVLALAPVPDRALWPAWARVLRYPGLWVVWGVAMGFATWPQRARL